MEGAPSAEARESERRAPRDRLFVFFVVVSIAAVAVGALTRREAPLPATPTNAEPEATAPAEQQKPQPQLPRGGRRIFPQHRLVGFCGTPGGAKLGRLRGNLPRVAKQIEALARDYAEADRTALPVFELIAVVALSEPGADGASRRRVPDAVVEDYLRAARAERALLLLNIQPGHSTFLTEAKHYDRFLREPDVGLALDPEWAMRSEKQTPGKVFGRTTGAAIDEVAQHLSAIVRDGDLPEKVLVFHQVNARVLADEARVVPRPGVVIVKSVDGQGPRASKIRTYAALTATTPPGAHAGFKLFFDEDAVGHHKLMTPSQVLALQPKPEYVMYE